MTDLTEAVRRQDLAVMAQLMDEAAANIRLIPEDIAEQHQVRHFLPDELEGSALMIRSALLAEPAASGAMGDDWLDAFDTYARQFTYRGHKAEPKHFPKTASWFEAGFKAGRAARSNLQVGGDVPEGSP